MSETTGSSERARTPNVAARNLAATIAVVTLLVGAVIFEVCSGSAPDRPEARCEALLDRFVELRVRAANPKASDYVLEQAKSEARIEAERTEALQTCRERLTEDAAACAERALTADQLEQCFP
ncbi:MAG: hypothetical protein HOW73_09650 [Polyangiaceae bacterium]|nr:hypothetical protein [Polyangiaceae bacterium]